MQKLRLTVLATLLIVCLAATLAVAMPVQSQADALFSQNFENYDGATSADSWVWNNCGMQDDSALHAEKLVNDECAIDGWSLKTGMTSAGTAQLGALLAFKSGVLPTDGGNYYMKLDVRFVNVTQFGFKFMETNTDVVLSSAMVEDTANVPAKGNGFKAEKHTDAFGDYYTIWFAFCGAISEGYSSWGGFVATSVLETGGYVVIDNMSVERNNTVYEQNFNGYDGRDNVPEWTWSVARITCDIGNIGGSTTMVSDQIDGYSLKIAASNLTANRAQCAGFSGNGGVAVSLGAGTYNVSFDVAVQNMNRLCFEVYDSSNGDAVFEGATMYQKGETLVVNGKNATAEKVGAYYHVSFDVASDGRNNWIGFSGEFGENGYFVLDNVEISVTERNLSATEEQVFADSVYVQRFDYALGNRTDSWAWNNLGWVCDAPVQQMVYGEQAIDNWSIMVGGNGALADNNLLCTRSESLSLAENTYYTVSFDVVATGAQTFGCAVKEVGTNANYGGVSVDGATMNAVSGDHATVTRLGNCYRVQFDVKGTGNAAWATFWGNFTNGYLVIDNFVVLPSANDHSRMETLRENFESHAGESAASYVWNHSHLFCDAPDAQIAQGFDGKALIIKQATAGSIQASSLLGLKGAGSDPTTPGNNYEVAFDVQTENVRTFGLKLMCVHSEYGDTPQAEITINMAEQSYTADCPASVTFDNQGVAHVRIQFAALGTELFGWFFANVDNQAQIVFDNYVIAEIATMDVPFVIADNGFESGELFPFTVETRFDAENQFLGMLTTDSAKVINGALSVFAGFDATNLSDKWGKLLGLDFSFQQGSYAIQFRYKVAMPSENFFYLELGGQNGKYVRFTAEGIVETSEGVSANVIDEQDGVKVLQAVFALSEDANGLLWGSYGGGFLSLDDVSVSKGTAFAPLAEISRTTLQQGELVFSEDFETQTIGQNLEVQKFVSGVDAFGYEYAYGCIDGKISLVMFNGGDWSEVVKTQKGLMSAANVYTLIFRYKKLQDDVSDSVVNVNVMLFDGNTNSKYVAFSSDGKVCAFTTSGGGFWKDISIAEVVEGNGCFEVKVTFIAPENAQIVLGQYGSAKIALDNVSLFNGFVGNFAAEAAPQDAPDKNSLLKTIANAKSLSETLYTQSSYALLQQKIAQAEETYNNLNATAEEVENALSQLENATDNLVELGNKLALQQKIAQVNLLNGGDYTEETWAALGQALLSAQETLQSNDVSQTDVDSAVAALQKALDGLVTLESIAQQEFVSAVQQAISASEKDKYDAILGAFAAYKKVSDKANVASDYAKLIEAAQAYNAQAQKVNEAAQNANQVAANMFAATAGVGAILACLFVAIKKLFGGAL